MRLRRPGPLPPPWSPPVKSPPSFRQSSNTSPPNACANASMMPWICTVGRGICDGPANYLQSAYQMVPVGITVEGANILTPHTDNLCPGRASLPSLTFTVKSRPPRCPILDDGLAAFEHAFTNHVSFAISNVFGALFHNLTGGILRWRPDQCRRRRPAGTAKSLAPAAISRLLADMTVALLGGGLKTKQKLTGRLADAISELYFPKLRPAALRR